MLGQYPIDVVLLATDIEATKDFYAKKVGLKILTENPGSVVFECGGGSRLVFSKSTVGTADEQTQASWRVTDIAAEIAELRSRGVPIQEYDMPGLKTVEGIADIGFAMIGWFIDPSKNCLGIMQLK